MDPLSSAQPTTLSAPANQDSMDQAPISPPVSPHGKPNHTTLNNHTQPSPSPRFPRNPCPSAHHTLSLPHTEHEAQRLFGASFTLRSPTTGELLGPFALLAYTDGWIYRYCAYIHRVVSTPLFTARERELIVLVVAGVTQAAYVVCSHRRIATSVGLSASVVEGALSGFDVSARLDLSPRERNVYVLASEMARNWGRVRNETWDAVVVRDGPKTQGQQGWLGGDDDARADVEVDGAGVAGLEVGQEDRLTREEVATLAQVLASTMFASVLVNCADAEVQGLERTEGAEQP